MSTSWNIGSVKITSLVELEAGAIIQQGIPDATPEVVKKISWLRPHFADEEGNLKAVVQAFVIETDGKKILVDSCVGNGKRRTDLPEWNNLGTDFLSRLESAGFPREVIDIVLCTHLHCDHIGWNTMLVGGKWVPTFPNARYLFAKDEYEYWKGRPTAEIDDDRASFVDSVEPIFTAGLADLVSADHKLTDEVSLLPTPGHTPCHVSVMIKSGDKEAVITGDVMHHPCQMAHPEWKVLWDTDKEKARETRKKFLDQFADTEVLILGSHFSESAGRIKHEEAVFRFESL
jgi:glyoxylase-like metal-dependent hydrolase (beta-lactamase superfamily II)